MNYPKAKAVNPGTRQKKLTQEPIAIRVPVIVLGMIVLLCAGLLVVPLWSAVVEGWQSHPNGQECDKSNDVAAQHNCYERLRDRATRHPAKGATAPIYRSSE
jgi:hypothetical protein